MININEQLLEELNEFEYFLLSMIAKYGKKCCPSNRVLCLKTSWGINKLQKAKKGLIKKNLLISSIRWKKLDGKLVRDSNEYLINTTLLGKYNKKQLLNDSSEVCHSEVVHSEVVHSEVVQNEVGIKVLKGLIIEKNKLLKEEKKKVSLLNDRILQLENQLQTLKKPTKLAEQIKALADESDLPNSVKTIFLEYDKSRRQMRKKIKTLRSAKTIINRLNKFVDKYGESKTIDCVNFVLDNAYIDIKEAYILPIENDKPSANSDSSQPTDLNAYLIPFYHPGEIRRMNENGKMEEYQKLLDKETFRLNNIAKGIKNPTFSVPFLFEALYLPLGKRLGGSNPERKLESLQRWLKGVSDYNMNKGDFRELLKERNKKASL